MNRDELLRKLEKIRDHVSILRQNAVISGQPWFAEQSTVVRGLVSEVIESQGSPLPSTRKKRIASKHVASSAPAGGET
tara:strand:+ start:2645 stop:2878 length:234 start_codon:yes stop_codon:yes gene_type:complete